jgi:hypothetical protein
MRADYYISAGNEAGHSPNSLHHVGRAVDIAAVNGTHFQDMDDARDNRPRKVLGNVTSGIPSERLSEMFSPAIAMRADRQLDAGTLESDSFAALESRTHRYCAMTLQPYSAVEETAVATATSPPHSDRASASS